jgi:hypothetical protein
MYSHSAGDDPIVRFAQPGASHSHDFFGNVSTNAFSTLNSLKLGGTSCADQPQDKSGYWMPSLYKNGVKVQPVSVNAYYTLGGKAPGTIRAFPEGLKIVAGNGSATTPQRVFNTSWGCVDPPSGSPSAEVPTCPGTSALVLRVRFPDCWDGKSLDSPDHKAHMAQNLSTGMCPSTHPVPVPELLLVAKYPIVGGSDVSLSSSGAYSGHADFFNAWQPSALSSLISTCLNGTTLCR